MSKITPKFKVIEHVPLGDFQLSSSWPQELPAVDAKDSLLNRQTEVFWAYEDSGLIYLWAESYAEYQIFINGQCLDLTNLPVASWVEVDLASLTKNGKNRLQIAGASMAKLQIKIPYPLLVNQSQKPEYKNSNAFSLIDSLINHEIENGFSSGQLVVVKNGKIVKQTAYGRLGKTGPLATNDSLYDIASNTKMWATNLALQKLVFENKLNLKAKINTFFPDFIDQEQDLIKGKSQLTVRDLLEHQAGFPADPQYFDNNLAGSLYTQKRAEVLTKIIATPLEYSPGSKTIYSDVDYMLLGLIIEEVSGEREDEYLERNIYQPLNLRHICFQPLKHGFIPKQIAPTELDGNLNGGINHFERIRTKQIQGEVHDPKAYYTMQGVSGHAGLFSNATDLACLAQLMLNRGGYGNLQLFDGQTIDEFIKPKISDPTFGLGWRRQADNGYARLFSKEPSTNTYGHTGWTGTISLVDPQEQVAVILLTNKLNTPIINTSPMDVSGNHYLTSRYGDIINLVYAGLNQDSCESNDYKLLNLLLDDYRRIDLCDAVTTADWADLKAIYETANERANSSQILKGFLKSNIGKEILQKLKEKIA